MTEYSKYNFVYRMQKWMDSVPGQTFLNYAYSWGAAVVILGTLFKLTHLPGANLMLFLGMGTEVVVFFLSAFDRPFDKTSIGRELATSSSVKQEMEEELDEKPEMKQTPVGGTIVIGGGSQQVAFAENVAAGGDMPLEEHVASGATASGGAWIADQQQMTPEMAVATGNYVEELKKLTEMLTKVNEQSARLTRDSEEMENLNRTLTGISKVYELQLKGASQQIGTIDQINEQTQKMAQQIEQLNKIYARMIEAMTVNMKVAAPVTKSLDDND